MAGYSYTTRDLDDQNRAYLPSPSLDRVSTYCPTKDLSVLEEPNLDPFYLEQSLPETVPLDTKPGVSDANGPDQYFMLSTVRNPSVYGDSAGSDSEHNQGFEQFAPYYLEGTRFSSEESFSSTPSEPPELSPSSSFSSRYSPVYPHAIRASQQLHRHMHGPNLDKQVELRPCTPPSRYKAPAAPLPKMARSKSRPRKPLEVITYDRNQSTSNLWKPLPTPPVSSSITQPGKKGSSNGRTPIDPSMISGPSLLDPVTLEPHQSHFDQAFFIPSHDCPSPVPSPSTPSPLFEREATTGAPTTIHERPSSSTFDPYCERSVWESDSDTESIGRKSLSRRPIDTLRKVRSRAKLRAAKSAPKLNASKQNDDEAEALENFPPIPSHFNTDFRKPSLSNMRTHLNPSPTKDTFHPSENETLRLVAPSMTSLFRPPSRKANPGTQAEGVSECCDVDSATAAAAMQAKSRRQRTFPETYCLDDSFHDESSDVSWHGKAARRDPFFRRVLKSIRNFSCRTDMPDRAVRPV